MKDKISLSKAKQHFDEVVEEVTHQGRRKIITRGGRPLVAVVPLQEAQKKKRKKNQTRRLNLVKAVGNWRDDQLADAIMEASRIMRQEMPRPVPGLDDE